MICGGGLQASPGFRMPVSVEFRSARPEEIATVVMPIERAGQPHPWSASMFAQELANDFSELELLLVDDHPVGFVVYWLVADEVHLLNVVVDAAARGRGHGERLVRRVISVAEEMGAEQVCLEVRVGNGAAIRLYERIGFRVMGRRPKYYADNGEDALLMGLAVTMP